MNARFRYLAADGEEVVVGTRTDVVHAITTGEIQGDFLLYDAEGGGWAPARNHSVFLAHAPGTASPGEGAGSGSSDDSEELEATPDTLSPGLSAPKFTFVPTPSLPTDQAVARVLRDRAEYFLPRVPDRHGEGFVRPEEDAIVVPAGGGRERPVPEPGYTLAPPPPVTGGSGASGTRFRDGAPASWRSLTALGPMGALGALTGLLGVLGLTLILTVLVSDARTRPGGESLNGEGEVAVSAATSPSGVPMSPIEVGAFEEMIQNMEGLQETHAVERVPPLWLEGAYLAGAGAHPEVALYWEAYATYVGQMREREGELFRQSLVRRLRAEGASESMVSIRIARALRTFGADGPRRQLVYAAHLELVSAALALHEFLVEHEQQISHAPGRSGVSRDPITEAVPETPAVGVEMNQHLDRLFAALERVEGQGIPSRDEFPLALSAALRRGAPTP